MKMRSNSRKRAEMRTFIECACTRKWDVLLPVLELFSVAPRFGIRAGGCSREHVLDHLRQHTLRPVGVVLLHGVLGWAAGVAMRHAGAVLECRVRMRITCFLKLLVENVNG